MASLALVLTLSTQSASAFTVLQAQAAPAAPPPPEQLSGTAAGRDGTVAASATQLHAGEGGTHSPAPGELPEQTDRAKPGDVQSSTTAPTAVVGRQVDPPDKLQPAAKQQPVQARAAAAAKAGKDATATAGIPGTDPVAAEVPSERTATTSVFDNGDGTRTKRIYSRPVHYKKSDGTWANIDTGLAQDGGGRWSEKANEQQPTFAAKADDPALVSWTVDASHRLSYSLQGAKAVPAAAKDNVLTYAGAAPSTDVVYNALAGGVKESLLLHDATAATTWVFPLQLTGLTPSIDQAGNVVFADATGKAEVTIPHGYMEDSATDPASGEGTISTAVTYSLTTVGGSPALQMSLDESWLHDAKRVWPVKVDPTTQTQLNTTRSTFVETPYNMNFASDASLKVGTYDGGTHTARSYIVFDSVGQSLYNDYVQKVELDVALIHSAQCSNHSVDVHAISSAWDPASVAYASQVPIDWNVLGTATSYGGTPCGSVAWTPFNLGDAASTPGAQLVNSWAHGGGNYGFALTTNESDSTAWKVFDSVNTSFPPYLKVTYVDWAANYSIPPNYNAPTYNTPGSQQVTMTNLGANWWNSSSMQVKPRFYDANWQERWPAGNAPMTGVPGLVQTGQSVTFNATIPPIPPGQSYDMCWDGYVGGTTSLYDSYGIPVRNCTWVSALNTDPQLDITAPLSNSVLGTVHPQLYASGHDSDNYPGTGVDYQFQVYSNPSSGSPQLVADSGWQPSTSWAVPSGLAWNSSYLWTVRDGDHQSGSAWANFSAFSTQVQQPVITSHLGGAAGDGSGRTFDTQVGNYTTDATDASVKAVGPELTVTRSYNSLDPRTSTLFGAGWTSAFDMRVQPDGDGSGSVVLTTASGRAARFGADPQGGSIYTPPPGEFESLSSVAAGFDLMVKDGTRYEFHVQTGGGYALSAVRDAVGHVQDLVYSSGRLATVTDAASGRALHFGWTADGRHVAKVLTDPAFGTDQSTALTWTYTYNATSADELDQVCAPPPGGNTAASCTTYTYGQGSHLRSAVLDSAPVSYWRLGDPSGSTAKSEAVENQGNDNARYSATGITLGVPGPTASSATAATFDGTSGAVTLPQSVLDTSSYTSVGLWFKTSGWGVLFSYQADTFPGSGTTSANYTPALYVGSSGKLHGKFWNGPSNPIESAAAVNDGKWHYALLSASGSSQTLYLDGQAQGTLAGAVIAPGQRSEAVGGGFISAWWADTPYDYTGRANFFAGSISDVAFYNRALGAPAIASLWQAGSQASPELSGLKLPSGKTRLAVTYDTVKDRAAQVTDENGGTWKLNAPTVSGSSQEYRGQVMGSRPSGYWRMSESAGVQAANQVYTPRPTPNNGTYSGVTLGGAGPMSGSTGAASFDGSTSWAELPASYAPQAGPGALGLWFRTSSAGVLLGYQSFPIGGSPNGTTDRWNPALYIGSDGRLRAQLWMGDAAQTMVTAAPVNDDKWHFAVLSADSTSSQRLYLDGAMAAGPLAGTISPNGTGHVFVGAGAVFGGWPSPTSDSTGHFKGQIADVAAFPHGLDSTRIATLYQLATGNGAAQYDAAIVDAHPTGYWRLGDTSGNQAGELISSAALAQNRGTNHDTTCCPAGPWASGSTTATGFNGTTSYVQLPANTAPKQDGWTTVELWFKTSTPGVLYGYQDFPLGSAHAEVANHWNPALYVGSDGKLYGTLWTGNPANALVTPGTVNNGAWHHVALTGSGGGQTLYLDGAAAATSTAGRPLGYNGSAYAYLGGGTDDGGWPNHPTDASGHFNGTIADFAIYDYPLVASAIATQYRVATTASTAGGLDASTAYRASVVQSGAAGYWRLDDPAGSGYAADELGTALPDVTSGTYTDATLNADGPSNDTANQRAAVFNGSTSALRLPGDAAPVRGPATMELWFKTTSGGPLYGYQDFPAGAGHSPGAQAWNPALYVGSDGRVHGEFWTGLADYALTSDRTVTDGAWHQVVLAADDNGQSLYLDGRQSAADTTARKITFNGTPYVYLGAAATDYWPAGGASYFNGSIAEASYYPARLDSDTVAAHYKAMGNGGTATPVTTATVTDPTGNTLAYRYDTRSSQLIARSDAFGNSTRYTYDTSGYVHTVTDPDGHTVTTGHDARGNTVSSTTCQDPAHCNTSYATYYLDAANALNPLNDKRLSSLDARSSGPSDTTYTTTYTYSPAGDLTSVTSPATADFPKGRTTYITLTTGTEQAVNSAGQPASGTQPVGLAAAQSQLVDANAYTQASSVPAGQQTRYSYDTAGNLTRTISPLGLTTTYTYDNLGRPASQTQACTNCGQGQTPTTTTTAYTWDGQGNLITRTDPATTDAVTGTVHTRRTVTVYDTDGDPTSQTIADTTGGDKARTTTWTYNAANDHLAQVTDPAGHKTSYIYDAYGNTTYETDAVGTTYTYTYSPMGQLKQTAIANYTGNPNNPVTAHWQVLESRAYDPAGRLATVADAMGRTTHTYYNDDDTVAETDLDAFHNFNPTTRAFDGSLRNVVLQQNTYDAAGHLTQRTTGGGKSTVTNSWDAAGRATSTTVDPGGLKRTSSYTYDAGNRVLSTRLTDGSQSRETDTTYDAVGDVLSATVKNTPQDSTVTSTYDQSGRPLTTISPLGNVAGADPSAYTTTLAHDAVGRLVVTTGPALASTVFNTMSGTPVTLPQTRAISRTGYGVFDTPTSAQDPSGSVTTFTRTFDSAGQHDAIAQNSYTAPGQITAVTPVTQIDYDALGRVKTLHDAKGQITSSIYDQVDNLVETDLPAVGGITPKWHYTYDLDGEKQSITDPTGAQTLSTYDDLGRPVTLSRQVRQGAGAPALYTSTFGYDDAGNRTTATAAGGATVTAVYDAAGEQTSTTDPLQRTTRLAYNLAGQPTQTIFPGSQTTTNGPSVKTSYDQAGQVTGTTQLSTTGASLASTSLQYDVAGNRSSETDADGNASTWTYDAAGRPVQHIQPTGTGQNITTGLAYDSASHRTAYTDGNNNTTYYTFNTLGLPESTIEPATSAYPNIADRAYTTGYDPLGEPTTVTEPGAVTISSTYDPVGHLISQSGTGGQASTPTRNFGYDLDGRLTSLSTPSGTQTYTYEDRGAIASASGPSGNSSYSYDADGQLTSRTNAAGTATFTYDAAGQLKTLAEPQTGNTIAYAYTPLGQVSSLQYGTGSTRTYAYDDQGNVTSDTIKTSTGSLVASLAYGYYPSGRLKMQTTSGIAGATTHTYGYDAAGRLSTWNNGAATTAYSYDGNGNLTSNGSTTATYNQRNQLSTQGSTAYTYTARGTRSTAVSGSTTTSATYDAFDELTAQAGQTYSYDALGRLAGNAGHSFTYDSITSNLTSDGSEKYTRTPGGSLTAIGTGTTAAFAYSNRHGDLVGTFTAASTTLAGSSAYDPWGKPTASAGTPHDLGYQGGWTDSSTGQVSTASRWYDPSASGFTSRDTANLAPTTSADANRYAYGNADPVGNADPSGHNPCEPDGAPSAGPSSPQQGPSAQQRKLQHLLDEDVEYSASLASSYNSMSYMESSASQAASGAYAVEMRWWSVHHSYPEILAHLDPRAGEVGYDASGMAYAAEASAMAYAMALIQAEEYALAASYKSCDGSSGGSAGGSGGGAHGGSGSGGGLGAGGSGGGSGASGSGGGPHIDLHTQAPVPCTTCSTTPQPGRPLNGGIEDGQSQTGIAQNRGTATGQQFSPGEAAAAQGLPIAPGAPQAPQAPQATEEEDPCQSDAFGSHNDMAFVYEPLEKAPGREGKCRATGAYAYLSPEDIRDKRVNPSVDPDGFLEIGPSAIRARGHLIASVYGGAGNDLRNFIPMYQVANQMMYDVFESQVEATLRGGGHVKITVTPVYGGSNSLIPSAVELSASGDMKEDCDVFNSITPTYKCGVNRR
ncbi:LamG-like jellyroll fold domain-containing protein [Kitasatospora sp. NPDC057223]|uniref:LamG-like jellyroll fold domain-containing protein n=1 Tax=Kitasatospora sp. NPDC057223 TaxID=3346055 RepID=UPI003640EB6C